MGIQLQLPVMSTLLLSLVCLGIAQERRTINGDPRCPVWMKPKAGLDGTVTCVCEDSLGGIVLCDQSLHTSQLFLGCCMTNDDEGENDSEIVGRCPFSYHRTNFDHLYVTLPQNKSELNTFMCEGLNRTGLLCSQCKPGLGPAVFSYVHQCLECLDSKYGWLLYIFLATFPTTVLFLVIVFFQVRMVTSAPMNAFIFMHMSSGCKSNKHKPSWHTVTQSPQPSTIFPHIWWHLEFRLLSIRYSALLCKH